MVTTRSHTFFLSKSQAFLHHCLRASAIPQIHLQAQVLHVPKYFFAEMWPTKVPVDANSYSTLETGLHSRPFWSLCVAFSDNWEQCWYSPACWLGKSRATKALGQPDPGPLPSKPTLPYQYPQERPPKMKWTKSCRLWPGVGGSKPSTSTIQLH